MLIAFNKPYGVLSQFTSGDGHATLAGYVDRPGVYAAGRLDADSEGLLLLTDDGRLQHAIADPSHRLTKRYWAEVEGEPAPDALARFADGLTVGEGADRYVAKPAVARRIAPPALWPRDPPIRVRANRPTCWLEIELREGRNRQVRRMTAAIGYPTLRLVRVGIGGLDLPSLGIAPGVSIEIEADRLEPASNRDTRTAASKATRRRRVVNRVSESTLLAVIRSSGRS